MRLCLRSFVLSLSLSLAFAANAWAGPVTGRVVDPDGRAVSGATVLLIDGPTVVATTLTDATGAFTLQAPHQGPFDIHTTIDGFRGRPVQVRDNANAGDITLQVSAVRESVLVSAAQVDIPLSTTSSSVTVLTGDELEALQVPNLPDALRMVPGLTIVSSGGLGALTSTFPRGGESDYSLVFVDGVQANAFGGGFDFAHVPLNNIERIEIVRGAQSALYGSNAIGSVVRIVTKRGGGPAGSAFFEGGSFDTTRFGALTTGTYDFINWGAQAERVASDGVVENDDYERWTFGGGAGWSSNEGRVLRGDVHYIDDERGFPGPFGADPGGTFSGIDTVSRGSNHRWLAAVSGATPAGSRVRVNGQLAFTRIDNDSVNSFGPSELSSRRTDGRVQADVTLQPSLQGSFGGEVQRESVVSTFITAAQAREVPVERTLAGFFGEVRWNRQSHLFVTAGVRAERIARDALPGNGSSRPDFDEDVVNSVNPKIGAAWFVRSADDGTFTKVRASAGTGIRPPDGFDIAFTDNPNLKPERSRTVEAGIDQSLAGGRASIEATVFYNRYQDLIVAVGSFEQSSRYQTDNISNARAHGVELSGTARARTTWQVPIDFNLRVAVTLLDTEILAVDGSSDAPPPFTPGDRLLRRPGRQLATELTVKGGRFSGFVTAGGRSTTTDVDPSFGTFGGLFEAPGYAVVNTGAAWRVTSNVELFGRITNLFDRSYEEALGFPALGRSAIGGLRLVTSR
jgi:outer membrane cobalamin receptor